MHLHLHLFLCCEQRVAVTNNPQGAAKYKVDFNWFRSSVMSDTNWNTHAYVAEKFNGRLAAGFYGREGTSSSAIADRPRCRVG